MPAAMLAAHQPRTAACWKKTTHGTGAGGYRHTAPTSLSHGGQKVIHIFQRNIVETEWTLTPPNVH